MIKLKGTNDFTGSDKCYTRYCSAVKKDKLESRVGKRMDFGTIMVGKVTQTRNLKYGSFSYVTNPRYKVLNKA